MQEHAWTYAAARTFGDFLDPRIVVIGDPPRAIAPLAVRRSVPGRFETLGVRELYEPVDLLWKDEGALSELAAALAALEAPLLFSRLPLDSPACAAVRDALGVRALVRVRVSDALPVVRLDDAPDDPEEIVNAGRRSDLRRARRHAEAFGEVAFELHEPGPREVATLLDEALAVEARGWKGRDRTALAHDELRLRFYRRYAQSAAAAGTLRINFLRIDGRTAAMQIAVERAGSLWLLKIGYDDEFASCSPGHLLMLECLRYALTRGLAAVEFLGAAAAWTRVWTARERPCGFVHVYPLSTRSLPALAHDGARLAARRLMRG